MTSRRPTTGPQPLRTHWGDVAQWYDQYVGDQGSDFHKHVIFPGVIRLLELTPGQHVLDLACGQGVLCRVLHQLGAKVTGVDAAQPLIEMARRRGEAGIEYVTADATDLAPLLGRTFDKATCVLAIQNIHPLPPVFNKLAKLIRTGGCVVMVMMHPCFRGPKFASWGWDEKEKVQYRRVDRYLLPRKEPILTHPGSDPSQYTWTFHRPIEAYVKALCAAGFAVDALEEWASHKSSTSGPRAPAENVVRKEIPMFLALRARRM